MRILVTGGAGFIGSHIVDALLARGHAVAVLDNLTTGSKANVAAAAELYEVDLRDRAAVQGVFAAFPAEVVFHHAAQADVRRSMDEPAYDAAVNILGSLHLLEAAARHGTTRFIYASSGGAIYGEPHSLPVREDHPILPLSNYGVSKATVEPYLRVAAATSGMRTTALRYANVYGPRQNPKGEAGVVAIFATLMLQGKQATIFGDGEKTRDYVYVEDIVRANLLAFERGIDGAFNIGTGVRTTDFEVYTAVQGALGTSLAPIYGPRRKGEVEHIALDAALAKEKLGWAPSVDFAEGVRRAVAFYRQLAAG